MKMRNIEGMVLFVGDNIDTDAIIPGRYLRTLNYNEMAQHVFEGISLEVNQLAKSSCIVIARENFGCGSSREQAALAIKFSGIQCVLARSYARIFYRNAINIGLLVMEYEEDFELEDYTDVCASVDLEKMTLTIDELEVKLKPLPAHAQEIIDYGGLLNYYKKKKQDLDPAPADIAEPFEM
jgi:3-isopropylmalate dehydratase small subunit